MQSANQQIVFLSDLCGTTTRPEEQTTDQLRTSSYCIFVKLPKRPESVLLVHGYTGAYDEVSSDVAAFLYRRRTLSSPLYGTWSAELDGASSEMIPSEETLAELETRGYLTRLSRRRELDYFRSIADVVHSFERKRSSYILVPSYDCNLRCPYCFQGYMRTDPAFRRLLKPMTPELVDRILAGIVDLEQGDPHQGLTREFTFFGGEPLSAANVSLIAYILRGASEMGPAAFGAVTNGTELDAYAGLLGPSQISSLQITLDGPPRVHDRFRIYKNGQGSFETIARNLSMALDHDVAVAVRVNVCADNLQDLPALAAEAEERGWAAHPRFQIYAAPIQPTENFRDRGRLFTSLQLNQRVRELRQKDPSVRMITTGDDSMRQRALSLFRNPEIDPVRDFKASFCGAHAAMYVFDAFGDIYACWEKLGDPSIRIGTVTDGGKFAFEAPLLRKWRERTVANDSACQRCPYGLHCGGGCAILAEAANNEYSSNYCDAFAARFKRAVADAYEDFLASENTPDQMPAKVFSEMRAGCA